MQEVRLHHASTGEVWAMTKCSTCGDVDKFPVAEAMARPVPCKKCGQRIDVRNATMRATGKDSQSNDDPLQSAPEQMTSPEGLDPSV